MTHQLQFESDGEILTVEVQNQRDDGSFADLVFVDHDIEYDISFMAMGGDPSTAYLLHYLWYDPDVAAEPIAVCIHNEEFMYGHHSWVRLNDVAARMVLSFSLSSEDQTFVVVHGSDFTIEQRLALLETMPPSCVANFLTLYNELDLRPDQRLGLESRLTPDQKGCMANGGGYYNFHIHRSECLRILLEATDTRKRQMVFAYASMLSQKAIRMILDSMVSEEHIVQILGADTSNLTTTDIMEYAEKLESPGLRRRVGMCAYNLSPEQRRYLMGEEP